MLYRGVKLEILGSDFFIICHIPEFFQADLVISILKMFEVYRNLVQTAFDN